MNIDGGRKRNTDQTIAKLGGCRTRPICLLIFFFRSSLHYFILIFAILLFLNPARHDDSCMFGQAAWHFLFIFFDGGYVFIAQRGTTVFSPLSET
jgi:hypothetical protein